MDQAGNRLRVSLVVLFSKINCGELESQKSFQVGLHPPHNFPWTHIVTDNLARVALCWNSSTYLVTQLYETWQISAVMAVDKVARYVYSNDLNSLLHWKDARSDNNHPYD